MAVGTAGHAVPFAFDSQNRYLDIEISTRTISAQGVSRTLSVLWLGSGIIIRHGEAY